MKDKLNDILFKNKIDFTVYMSLFCGLIIVLISLNIFNEEESVRIVGEELVQLSDAWYINDSEEPVSFPARIAFKGEDVTKFTTTLPYSIKDGDALFYNCSYMAQEVYIGNRLVWSFAKENTMPFGSMRGNAYAIVNLSTLDSGKTLTILMTNPFGETKSEFSGVFFGKAGEMKFNLLYGNLWRILFFIGLATISVFAMVFGMVRYLVDKKERNMTFLYYAMLTFTVGLWILMDSAIMQFFTDEVVVIQFVAFITLLLVGYYYMGLCKTLFANQRLFFKIMQDIGLLMLIVMIILYISNVADPVKCILPIYLYVFGYIILSAFVIIHYRKQYMNEKMITTGAIVLLVGVLLGLIAFIWNPTQNYSVKFFMASYGFYIVVLFLYMLQNQQKMMKDAIKLNSMQKMAYTDILTGLYNRAAFEKDLEEIRRRVRDKRLKHNVSKPENNYLDMDTVLVDDPVVVGLFLGDLNFLKKVNDEQGHKKGDEYIIAASRCLNLAFQDIGKCYRLGGDEFAVLIENSSMTEENMLKHLDYTIDSYKDRTGIAVSMAMGYAECKLYTGDEPVDKQLYSTADERMYARKKEMKGGRE